MKSPSQATPASPASPVPPAPSFEEAVKRLGEIVASLERGDLSLEDSLRLFEEGVQLARVSQEKLDVAQKKVEQLLGVDDQGRAKTQPFEVTVDDEEDDR
jgi:exodeoxyribonuclease VII small subunit